MAGGYDGSLAAKLAAAERRRAAEETARLAQRWGKDAVTSTSSTPTSSSAPNPTAGDDGRAAALAAAMAEARRTPAGAGAGAAAGAGAQASTAPSARARKRGAPDAADEASKRLTEAPPTTPLQRQQAALLNMVAESRAMEAMWVKGVAVLYVCVAAGLLYLMVSQATTPFAEGAALFAPLAARGVQSADIVLPLLMNGLAVVGLGAGQYMASRLLLAMSALPGAVPLLAWPLMCTTHNAWSQWQLLWIPALYPALAASQLVVARLFHSYQADLLRVHDRLAAPPKATT